MLHRFSRTELLIGTEGLTKLQDSCVAVFGLGGVGSYTAEALARAAVGKLVIVDYDLVCLTNVNRQLHAMIGTIGKPKVEVMAERIKKINPKVELVTHQAFYSAKLEGELLADEYDYVVDAIDNVTAKLHLIASAHQRGLEPETVLVRRSSLEDVFLRLTGRSLVD